MEFNEINENEKVYGQTIDQAELDAWMAEPLDWSDLQPADAVSWKQK